MIGDLRSRIIIQKLEVMINDNGFEKEVWKEHLKVWALVKNLSGREFYQASSVKAESTVKFIIRYTDKIDTSMRIEFREKTYEITHIDNIKYENKYIEIKAIEVSDG